MITDGIKTGRVLNGRFIEAGEKGTPGLEVAFSFEEQADGTQHELTRVFWLTKPAIKASMETLFNVLKYSGAEEMDADGIIIGENVFTDELVSLTIATETYKGVARPKISWVNSLELFGKGGGGLSSEKLDRLGFAAAFLAEKNNAETKAPVEIKNVSEISEDEIPF